MNRKAVLALENGSIFYGDNFGASGERAGEILFNTGMTGYQEIMTDPSYAGQMVVMTYPLIGNYGVNKNDIESNSISLEALLVRELSPVASNWSSRENLNDYMKNNNVFGIQGLDTRALAKQIRVYGAMKAIVSTVDLDEKRLVEKARLLPGLVNADLVKTVSCKEPYQYSDAGRYRVAVLDCGVKYNILRNLESNNCSVRVFPARTDQADIFHYKPHGLLVSNGPGDPSAVDYVIDTVKQMLGRLPIMGICLGHQIISLAIGAKTYKLKFGHHGSNHPVRDLRTGRCYITSQNHGFCVEMDSINDRYAEPTHINLNDNTLEGIINNKLCFFAVQFHPEAGPGPNDAAGVFADFTKMMEAYHAKKD
jgi:carbamoyl-phosphate synthase small subunit